MNSAIFVFGTALASVTFAASVPASRSVSARSDLTLLTGPHLLSTTARPLESATISSEVVTPAKMVSTSDLNAARVKRTAAKDRLERLKSERASALTAKRKADSPLSEDASQQSTDLPPAADRLRFDTKLTPTSKNLLQAAPLFKRD